MRMHIHTHADAHAGTHMVTCRCADTQMHRNVHYRPLHCIGQYYSIQQISNYTLIFSGQCFSTEVGKSNNGGRQILNLGDSGCFKHGILIHELMHILGSFHEVQRMDRDIYVHIFWANIAPLYLAQYKTTLERGYKHEDIGAYDYGSIMHYPRFVMNPFVLNPNKQTMTATIKIDGTEDKETSDRKWQEWHDNNAKMGQREKASDEDIFKLGTLYCTERTTSCEDKSSICVQWVSSGRCSESRYERYMQRNCRQSCQLCGDTERLKGKATVLKGSIA